MRQYLRGLSLVPAGRMHFNDAIKIFEEHISVIKSQATVRGQIGDLKRFCIYLHNAEIETISIEEMIGYIRLHLEFGWKRDTLMAMSLAFRKFFEYWGKRGEKVVDWQLIPIIHKDGARPRVATREQVQRLLEHTSKDDICSVRDHAIIRLLAETGVRNGELCGINVNQIEKSERNNGQYATVIRTEKRKGILSYRRIFWYRETNLALERWIARRAELAKKLRFSDPEALFIAIKGGYGGKCKRLDAASVGVILKKASFEAGIEPVNPHSLRHLFGNTAAAKGLNNSSISGLMGHAKLESSFIYTQLSDPQLAEAHREAIL